MRPAFRLAFTLLGLAAVGLAPDSRAQVSSFSIPVGGYPQGIAVNPTTNQIYVETSADNLAVIDGATGTATTLAIGVQGPMAVNPVTNQIYVSNGPFSGIISPAELAVIDGTTHAVSIIAPGSAGPIAINPVTNTIYVVNLNNVTAIDGATHTVTTIIDEANLGAIAVNPATNRLYVSNSTGGYVDVVDGSSGTVIAVVSVLEPSQLAVDPVRNKVYVTSAFSSAVAAIDGATNATTFVDVGYAVGDLAVNSVTGKVYVTNNTGVGLTVIDEATQVATTVPIVSYADVLLVNPVTNQVYVAGQDPSDPAEATFLAVDGTTLAAVPLPASVGSGDSAINPVTGTLYVAHNTTADVAAVTVPAGSPSAPVGRLVNLSARAFVGSGGAALIPGFVVAGSGSETLLVRAIGPGLASFGVPDVLAQPVLRIYNASGTVIASNAGWSTGANAALLARTAAQVGAFALDPANPDCAVLVSVPAGTYTAEVSGANNGNGTALAEVYEVAESGTRLINLGTRALAGGGNALIMGFVIAEGPDTLLARGDGPALDAFGVPGALAEPTLALLGGAGAVVASNQGWAAADTGEIEGFEAALGAFSLVPGSADCAQVIALPPGAYTAVVGSAGNSSGVALAEIFEAP